MGSRLLNVRLDVEDANIARQLRARGVSISDVVRRALRNEAKKLAAEPIDSSQLLDELLLRHPTPKGPAPARPSATDRVALRKHIASKLRRR
jgi:negative regulator of replication initiation